MRSILLTLIMISLGLSNLAAQTCCSGGVPLSNAIGLPLISKKALQVKLSYDYNNLSTLIQDDEKIEDDSRTRVTHTALLQLGMAISPRFSVELLLPYIKQDRTIQQISNTDYTSTNGIGDITSLLTYSFTKQEKKYSLSGSIGIKAPTGATDNKNNQGIILNADMQPGTGAWDMLTMVRYIGTFPKKKNNSFYASLIANFKGTNPDYQPNLSYQFGNEQQLSLGINSQVFALKSLWDLGLGMRFRNVLANKINNQLLKSTGGKWIYATTNMTYWMNPGKTSLNIGADIPIYTVVSGLQNVPTYRLNISVYSLINWGEE